MKGQRLFIWSVCLLLLLGVSGCTPEISETETLFCQADVKPSENGTVILLTMAEKEGTFTYECALHFRQILEAADANLHVDIYPDNEIGSMELSDKMLYDGRVQIRLGPGPSKLVHLMGLTSLSGLSEEMAGNCMDDPEWQNLLQEECALYKTRILGILPASERVVTSAYPLERVSDFRGLSMRGTNSVYSMAIWEPLGCNIKKVALDSADAAFHHQLVDAWADNTMFHYLYYQRYEAHPYVTSIKQQIYLEPFYVSEEFYQSLSQEQKDSLEWAVRETIDWAGDYRKEWLEERLADMEAAGAVFHELPEEEIEKITDLVYDSVYALMQERLGGDLLTRALHILKKQQ